jgi:hypothetical protein
MTVFSAPTASISRGDILYVDFNRPDQTEYADFSKNNMISTEKFSNIRHSRMTTPDGPASVTLCWKNQQVDACRSPQVLFVSALRSIL